MYEGIEKFFKLVFFFIIDVCCIEYCLVVRCLFDGFLC